MLIYQVLYEGDQYLVENGDLPSAFSQDVVDRLTDIDHATLQSNLPAWKQALVDMRRQREDEELAAKRRAEAEELATAAARIKQLQAVEAELHALKKQDLAIVDIGVYEVSPYTEGTGFRAEVLNTGKRDIKYVTLSFTGLNAVGDPVPTFYGKVIVALRGIGPIAVGSTASYSRDYIWYTDVVQTFRLNEVKIEFMGGGIRVIKKPLHLSPAAVVEFQRRRQQ